MIGLCETLLENICPDDQNEQEKFACCRQGGETSKENRGKRSVVFAAESYAFPAA